MKSKLICQKIKEMYHVPFNKLSRHSIFGGLTVFVLGIIIPFFQNFDSPPPTCLSMEKQFVYDTPTTCICPKQPEKAWPSLHGSDPYQTHNSAGIIEPAETLCSAAVHAGKMTTSGGVITFIFYKGKGPLIGSTRNGVTTMTNDYYHDVMGLYTFDVNSTPQAVPKSLLFSDNSKIKRAVAESMSNRNISVLPVSDEDPMVTVLKLKAEQRMRESSTISIIMVLLSE